MNRVAWLFVFAAGCFRPSPPEGAPCGGGTECPDPLVCEMGICVRAPHDGGLDADISIDADLTCLCQGTTLMCESGSTPCNLGCMDLSPGARCIEIDPSNDVGITSAASLTTDITITTGTATFNTDSGAITGALTRAAGQGVIANIAYEQRLTGTQPIGVWTFHRLALNNGATIRFSGARSAVFVSGTTVSIAGTIDGSGGCYGGDPACAGPGAGTGGAASTATGCGPGGAGAKASSGNADGGGGGGGGRGPGAVGGLGGSDGNGGTAGSACIAMIAEPLVGGSGGGAGASGNTTPCKGGGGGGALQITAIETIAINGTITMGGSGGEGGPPDPQNMNAAAGCGGGAGGSILLEAPQMMISSSGVLAANGGGGGGGAPVGMPGNRGASGGVTAAPASGGAAISPSAAGGDGAAGATAAAVGSLSPSNNAGGGGGGIGTVYLRTSPGMLTQSGLSTPTAGTGAIRTQ